MNFKYYDLLSHLVPGYLIYQVLVNTIDKIPDLQILPEIAIAFILGFIVNALSSWIEDFIYWTWGGKPSNKLLKGQGTYKVKFHEFEKAYTSLKEESGENNPKTEKLFEIAMKYALLSNNKKIDDLNASYAFSRVLLTCTLTISILIFYNYYTNYLSYCILIPLIVIVWLRAKDKGYYYAKEVLITYLSKKII